MVGGYFTYPRIPVDVVAELRNGSAMRWKLKRNTPGSKPMTGWLYRYFPFQTELRTSDISLCHFVVHAFTADLIHQEVENWLGTIKRKLM